MFVVNLIGKLKNFFFKYTFNKKNFFLFQTYKNILENMYMYECFNKQNVAFCAQI